MIFLTYNDPPSGIYSSQVIDVCRFLNRRLNADTKLVSLVSLRTYFRTKKVIKSELPNAIVLPMFPGVQNWRYNWLTLYILFLFIGKQSIIARGPFATSLALSLKKNKIVKNVCFDARGAYDAEFNEYNIANNINFNKEVFSVEQNAVLKADFRIAVSNKLVNYWKEKFGYEQTRHVMIPCGLNSLYFEKLRDQKKMDAQRNSLGYSDKDVVFVYSGSSSGWQSLKLLDDFLCSHMKRDVNARALLLIKNIPDNMNVVKTHPDRVAVKWFTEEQVPDVLFCCDYGLLIRERSVTNSVASPVKFAEYLAAGLKVIISENIGDYSDFVQQNNCGYLLDSFDDGIELSRPTQTDKEYNANLAATYFRKEKYLDEYTNVYKNIV